MLKRTDFGSCDTPVAPLRVNVLPLGDEAFLMTAFIKLDLFTDRWELCVMGWQGCIRAAATFYFKPDLPVVPLHKPPPDASLSILLLRHGLMFLYLSKTSNRPHRL